MSTEIGSCSLTLATALVVSSAALHDWRTRRIPNQLVLAGCGIGILLNIWSSGLTGLMMSVAGCGAGLVLMLPGFLLRFTGGGDVKLLAAVGSLLGPELVLYAFAFSIMAGGTVAIVQSVYAWAVQGAASSGNALWGHASGCNCHAPPSLHPARRWGSPGPTFSAGPGDSSWKHRGLPVGCVKVQCIGLLCRIGKRA